MLCREIAVYQSPRVRHILKLISGWSGKTSFKDSSLCMLLQFILIMYLIILASVLYWVTEYTLSAATVGALFCNRSPLAKFLDGYLACSTTLCPYPLSTKHCSIWADLSVSKSRSLSQIPCSLWNWTNGILSFKWRGGIVFLQVEVCRSLSHSRPYWLPSPNQTCLYCTPMTLWYWGTGSSSIDEIVKDLLVVSFLLTSHTTILSLVQQRIWKVTSRGVKAECGWTWRAAAEQFGEPEPACCSRLGHHKVGSQHSSHTIIMPNSAHC